MIGINPQDDEFLEEVDKEMEMSFRDLDKLDENDNDESWLDEDDKEGLPF